MRLDGFGYGAVTLSGRASLRVLLPSRRQFAGGPATPRGALLRPRFGLLRFRSPLLAESLLFSFPAGTEMFQFPAFARRFSAVTASLPPGFPIRTSAVRAGICPSPPLFAACHVLLRLREPQASPMRPSLLSFFFSPSSDRLPRLFRPGCSILQFDCSLFSRISSSLGFGCFASASFQICLSIMSMTSPFVVEDNGFEPMTPCVQGRCSSQLS